jgi:hypothetical protein
VNKETNLQIANGTYIPRKLQDNICLNIYATVVLTELVKLVV